MLRILSIILLTACSAIPPQAQQVTFTLETMPYEQLAEKCAEYPRSVACTDGIVYVQGEESRKVIMLNVEYLNWADINAKCKTGSCFDNGTLYTSASYSAQDRFRMGEIGDELNMEFGLNLDFNRRAQLGHEVYTHILGNSQDEKYANGAPWFD